MFLAAVGTPAEPLGEPECPTSHASLRRKPFFLNRPLPAFCPAVTSSLKTSPRRERPEGLYEASE
jgi:hypothetical protein